MSQHQVRFVECEGNGFAHIAAPERKFSNQLEPLCGAKAFPWDWHQPVTRSKPLCRGCVGRVRR